ncbi:MAG: hypothetical protein IPK81_21955 [Rhodospirillales bacterium]|nr:MAG: hypothetical protein IPK81_21955 [Rhodospirillales bacterium]
MGTLITLALRAAVESGAQNALRDSVMRAVIAGLCAMCAAVLTLAALGCAVAALWIHALPTLGPAGAPLAAAAALVGAALAAAGAAWLVLRRPRRRVDPTTMPRQMLAEAGRMVGQHKGAALLAALVAGMVVARGGRGP